MARWKRMDRVNQLILEEVAKVVQGDIQDPKLGFVTVLSVQTSPDLINATVSITALATSEGQQESVAVLNRAAGFIRNLIRPHLHLKKIPSLEFVLDDTQKNAERISGLLDGNIDPDKNEGNE